ncbi:MAG: AAA family ATPase [Janthinobacterium lividum]
MYIKSIRLTNFQSYYGSDNKLVFEEGLNIVVGSINKGKSKLFDAFYWVLFNEIFITGADWINTNNLPVKSSFINDKAKYLANNGDILEVGVEIVLCHNDNDEVTEFRISRSVTATRLNVLFNWYDAQAWEVSNPRVEITYQKNHNTKIIDTFDDFEEKVHELFPKEIRNYVWFQGEALDKLIDFSNKSTFEQAIKYISYYPRYEKLSEIVKQTVSIIDKEKNKKIKNAATDKQAYEEDFNQLTLRKSELQKLDNELQEWKIKEEKALLMKQEVNSKMLDLKEFPPLQADLHKYQSELDAVVAKIDSAVDKQKDQFQKVWILNGIDQLVKDSKKVMHHYEEEKHTDEKYALPADVPAKVFLQKMLSEGKCLVCGSDASPGTDTYEHICNRIELQAQHFQKMQDNNNLDASVQQLLTFPDEVLDSISDVESQMVLLEEEMDKHLEKRGKIEHQLNDVKSQIDFLMHKHNITLADAVDESEQHWNRMSAISDNLSEVKARIAKIEQSKIDKKYAIDGLQAKIDSISLKNDVHIPEKVQSDLAAYMQSIVSNVKERAKSNLVGSIESKANEYYSSITKHNRAVDGKISIDPLTYKITRTEDDIYVASNPNMGNFTLMKMCIINAMLSLNEQFTGTRYPFIADAPTSNLDADTTIAYIKSLSGSFGQSIIITKDIEKARLHEIKNDSSVRTIHLLETHSDDPSASKYKQHEAFTKVKRAK